MKATDIFTPPFRAEGAFIYSSNGVLVLMASNCGHYPKELVQRIVQILNGESKPNGSPDIGINANEVCINGDPVLTVRGWLHLIDDLQLPEEEAAQMQEDFAVWVVYKLRGEI